MPKSHPDGTLDYDDFENKICNKTKIACLSHVSNVTGVINDVKRIGKVAHDNGALMLVDGAQSVPHMKVDVQELGHGFSCFFRTQNAWSNRHRSVIRQERSLGKDASFHGRGRNDKGSFNQREPRGNATFHGMSCHGSLRQAPLTLREQLG